MLRTVFLWLLEQFWSEWQHVGTFTQLLQYRKNYENRECKAYIHCYESRWGTRRSEILIARDEWFNGDLKKKVLLGEIYQTKIFPWLNGRINTEIPGFQLVKSKKWDFKKILKGETPVVLNDDEKE